MGYNSGCTSNLNLNLRSATLVGRLFTAVPKLRRLSHAHRLLCPPCPKNQPACQPLKEADLGSKRHRISNAEDVDAGEHERSPCGDPSRHHVRSASDLVSTEQKVSHQGRVGDQPNKPKVEGSLEKDVMGMSLIFPLAGLLP